METIESNILSSGNHFDLDGLIASETNIEGILGAGHDIDIASSSMKINKDPVQLICNAAKTITHSFLDECKQYRQTISSRNYQSLSSVNPIDYPIFHELFARSSPSIVSSILFLSGSLALILRMRNRKVIYKNDNDCDITKTPVRRQQVHVTHGDPGNYDDNTSVIDNDNDNKHEDNDNNNPEDNDHVVVPKINNTFSQWGELFK